MSRLLDTAQQLYDEAAAEMVPQHDVPVRADFIIRMGLTVIGGEDHECQSSALPTTNRPSAEWEAIRVIDANGVHHIFRRERPEIKE